MKSPIALLAVLLKDFSRIHTDVRDLRKDYQTLRRRFKDEGYGFLAVALPQLGKSLDRGLADGRFSCPRGFKTVKGGTIPAFLSGMFRKVFDDQGTLLQAPDTLVLRDLRRFLYMWKKLQLDVTREKYLDEVAKEKFFSDDEGLEGFTVPSRESYIIKRVSGFVLRDLDSVNYEELVCKHGPGAVYEGLSPNQKWHGLNKLILDGEFDDTDLGFDMWKVSRQLASHLELYPLENAGDLGADCDHGLGSLGIPSTSGVARLMTVPKSSTARRTITIEPLKNQFVQGGLNVALRDCINKCSILSRCLALSDQSLNQYLALNGSITGRWATLDLSRASDLLSVSLVENSFYSHRKFFSMLMSYRSSHIVSTGFPLARKLEKFAGMGNATTFPVQSVCYAIVSMAAILDSMGRTPTKRNLQHAASCIRVYGDDIIVRSDYAQTVVDWLTRVGLIVNADKSFTVGNFRESCGLDAFWGEIVTPVYVQYQPDKTSIGPDELAGLVSSANSLRECGYHLTSEALFENIEEALGKRLPYVLKESGALGRTSILGYSDVQRWNPSLQRLEVWAPVSRSRKRSDLLDGDAALLKSFLTSFDGRKNGHLERTDRRYNNVISWRWVPATKQVTSHFLPY